MQMAMQARLIVYAMGRNRCGDERAVVMLVVTTVTERVRRWWMMVSVVVEVGWRRNQQISQSAVRPEPSF